MKECNKGCNCSSPHKNGGQDEQTNGYKEENREFLAKLYLDLADSKKDCHDLSYKLIQLPGVHELRFLDNYIEIIYDDMLISPQELKKKLKGS